MLLILELLLGSIRVLLLFYGAVFTYLLGEQLYVHINKALFAYSIPCLELLSFIIAFAAPLAYFYGIHHKTAIFNREKQTNIIVFLVSFLFGIGITFLPLTGLSVNTPYCIEQISLLQQILHSLLTGIATAFVVFLSLDIGVFQAMYISPLLHPMRGGSVVVKKNK